MSDTALITLAGMASLVLITLINAISDHYADKKEAPKND